MPVNRTDSRRQKRTQTRTNKRSAHSINWTRTYWEMSLRFDNYDWEGYNTRCRAAHRPSKQIKTRQKMLVALTGELLRQCMANHPYLRDPRKLEWFPLSTHLTSLAKRVRCCPRSIYTYLADLTGVGIVTERERDPDHAQGRRIRLTLDPALFHFDDGAPKHVPPIPVELVVDGTDDGPLTPDQVAALTAQLAQKTAENLSGGPLRE